jgi:hypothetical protein
MIVFLLGYSRGACLCLNTCLLHLMDTFSITGDTHTTAQTEKKSAGKIQTSLRRPVCVAANNGSDFGAGVVNINRQGVKQFKVE